MNQPQLNLQRVEQAGLALPCLNSNISIAPQKPVISQREKQRQDKKKQQLNEFSTSHKKTAHALELNVKSFIEKFGINHVGFMTLTFADNVICSKEAQRRFNSLRTNFLKKYYQHYIRVLERQKSGRIHYHLIVAVKENIRRGIDFSQIANKNYKSANSNLKKHWSKMRTAMQKYGFGRSELMPIKTNSKGLSRYVSKYISKHINQREQRDIGVRLSQTSIDKKSIWKVANANFMFLSGGSLDWMRNLRNWVNKISPYFESRFLDEPLNVKNYSDILKKRLGAKWAFLNREEIINLN